ncbi:GntR family transcriptional regulator [Corallococcus exercitus]|uniref:FadR/GntR family transcriptional regulator n=1 Tax=Corallococcus exercitus TaxID=2316736 RepID=UPI000EA02DFE|nr:GntR family transcriptional regulator [Corallococcus exercitus]
MVQVGLVAYVEEQLEREISLGRLPRNGQLGSEYVLARRYGVSRSTVREALRRLAARGLVVQRPGRVARAVALDESLTLENLGLALHDERSKEGLRLLEGYFSLKRQVLVELLVDCCASASEADRHQLEATCFNLWDAAKWEPGARCAQLEFELLRLAAQAAARPGHLLLIQSLQRAMRGKAARLLSFMGGEPLRQWAVCAMHALGDRDTQALQHRLPALLKTCDASVLAAFVPASQEPAASEAHFAQGPLCAPTSATGQGDTLEELPCMEARGLVAPVAATGQGDALEALPCVEARGVGDSVAATGQHDALEALPCMEVRGLGAPVAATGQGDALEALPCVEARGVGASVAATGQHDALEAPPCVEKRGLGAPTSVPEKDEAFEARSSVEARRFFASASVTRQDEALETRPFVEDHQALRAAPCHAVQGLSVEPDNEALLFPATSGLAFRKPGGEGSGDEVTDSALSNLSDCRTGWDASSLEGGLQPEDPSTGSRGQSRVTESKEGGPLHGTQGPLVRWAARLWRFIVHSLGLPAS